jgi:hypothetical protein
MDQDSEILVQGLGLMVQSSVVKIYNFVLTTYVGHRV